MWFELNIKKTQQVCNQHLQQLYICSSLLQSTVKKRTERTVETSCLDLWYIIKTKKYTEQQTIVSSMHGGIAFVHRNYNIFQKTLHTVFQHGAMNRGESCTP
jgi:hypothetical protein